MARYEVNLPGATVDDLMADMAIRLEQIIEARKIRDWTTNLDVQRQIQREMDEYLCDLIGRYDIPLSDGDLDMILDSVLEIAKQRDRM